MTERKPLSTYVLFIELDAPGGGDRKETFAYSTLAYVMSALRQELEGRLLGRLTDTIEAICIQNQSLILGAIQRGKLVAAINIRRHLRVRDEEGVTTTADELEAEWDEVHGIARRIGSDAPIVAIELDEHAILEALPPLEEPLITHGQIASVTTRRNERKPEIVALAKALKKGVCHGYSDAAGEYVSRERFDDPSPPSLDDLAAWMVQHPNTAMAIEIAKSIAAQENRDAARRWVEKARREALPVAKIEAVLREAFPVPEGSPPLRRAPERVDIDHEVLERDPRWEKLAEVWRALPIEGVPTVEERLRLLSRETDDPELAVVALMLRRHLGRARGPAHSALMLRQAMQRSSETILPGVALAEELESGDRRAIEALEEAARRLLLRDGRLGPADTLLVELLPLSFDARRIERAAARLADAGDFAGAARILALAEQLVSDPAEVSALACERARLSIRAGTIEKASAPIEEAISYWNAHAWMRGAPPGELFFWRAAIYAARGDRTELDAMVVQSEKWRALAARELEFLNRAPEPEPAPTREEDDGTFHAGALVSHAKFGLGIVERVERSGTNAKLVVRFDSGETKLLLERFLTRR